MAIFKKISSIPRMPRKWLLVNPRILDFTQRNLFLDKYLSITFPPQITWIRSHDPEF
jgi:hypothetical protein